MIVCPQPLAAEIGRDVLRRGGNAVDAAVAAAFCQGVVDPQMCGLGGSGVMLHYSAAEQRSEVLEFYARAGGAVKPDQWEHLFIRESADRYGYVLEGAVNDAGYQAVGVPGTVAGLRDRARAVGNHLPGPGHRTRRAGRARRFPDHRQHLQRLGGDRWPRRRADPQASHLDRRVAAHLHQGRGVLPPRRAAAQRGLRAHAGAFGGGRLARLLRGRDRRRHRRRLRAQRRVRERRRSP